MRMPRRRNDLDPVLVPATTLDDGGGPAIGFLRLVAPGTPAGTVDGVGGSACVIWDRVVGMPDRRATVRRATYPGITPGEETSQPVREAACAGLHCHQGAGFRVGEQPTQRDVRVVIEGIGDDPSSSLGRYGGAADLRRGV